jgi:succinate dehydrogenase flavin-adding protein (antitoxin of CptAB toxin-antitoxin module)
MQLYRETIEQIDREVIEQFKAYYQKFLYEKKQLPFETYYYSVTAETWDEVQNLMQVTKDTLYPITKRRQVTKNRWGKKELEGGITSGFHQEVDVVDKTVFERLKEANSDILIIQNFKHNTFEEHRENQLKELKEWMENEELPTCEFPYLKYKSWTQIEPALVNDIKYCIIKEIKDRYPTGERVEVLTMPNSMTNLPYDHSNRNKMQSMEIVKNQYIREIYINDNTVFETRLSVEALNEELMRENLKLLNALDHQILLYLMSSRHEALYQPIPMVVDIGSIVKDVFKTKSQKNYMAVKGSIVKMSHMQVSVYTETLLSTNVKIFHNAVIGKDEVTQREVARIIFSEELINEFVKDQTVSIYKKIIDQFTLNTSKILIYALQRQRNSFVSSDEVGNMYFQTNLNFFRGVLFIGTSKRSVQVKTIEKALNEIIKSNITLKSFNRKGDNFILEFYPFTEEEKRDLLNNKAPEKFLLNRSRLNDGKVEQQTKLTQ